MQNCVYILPAALAGILLGQALGGTGVNGLAFSFVCAEILTVLTAYIYRKIKYKGSDFYILPAENEGVSLDLSVAASLEEAVKIPEEMTDFARSRAFM